MISLNNTPVRRTARMGAARLGAIGAASVLGLSGCHGGAPKGQVVAVVNGQEVTYQDLSAEARATRAARADPKALLQKVLGRVLLAQDAHGRGLDRYAGYPADIARLQQNFLAEREVQTRIKAPDATPSAADVHTFMAAHPYIFAGRMHVQLDELHFQNGSGVKGLEDMTDLSSVVSRLKELSIPFDRQTHVVDTADLPPALAQRFVTTNPGQLTFLKTPNDTVALVVKSRASAAPSDEQATALADRMIGQLAVQSQINAMLTGLAAHAKITYQKGFAPATPQPNAPAKSG